MITLEIDETKLLPGILNNMDAVVDYILLGYKMTQMCKIEVTGIDKPILNVCRTIETEIAGSRTSMDKHLDLLRESVLKTTEGVVHRVGVDIEKHIIKIDSTNKPLLDRIDHLNRNVESLLGGVTTSSKRGRIGENILLQTLEKQFPHAVVENTATTKHQSDIHFTFPQSKEDIWIEVKTYSDTVPTKEVDKFKREMQDNKVKYGIFTSRSGIAKHHQIEVEETSYGGYVFYLPNVDTESKLVVFALMWIKFLDDQTHDKKDGGEDKLNQGIVFDLIKSEVEQLGRMTKHYYTTKQKVEKSYKALKRELDKSMEDVVGNLSNLEMEFEKSIAKLSGILSVI